MILFRGCEIFAPEPLGKKDLLVSGGRIEAVATGILPPQGIPVEVMECSKLRLIPGLIDAHVHIAGAGGEGGPATRTPEIQPGDALEGGVTTLIGMLGTDGVTRNVESVLMKARGLKASGLSCYILSGAYQVPSPTITGDPARDIICIDECLGVGEVAIGDHRDSTPTIHELARLASAVRLGGLLGAKTGVLCLHLGDDPGSFRLIREAAAMGHIPLKHFLPTHCNRSAEIFDAAMEYALAGGRIDLTTSAYPNFPDEEVKPSRAVRRLLDAGVSPEGVTMSSDGGGSLPDFDDEGNLRGLKVGRISTLFTEMRDLITEESLPPETAIRIVSTNVAGTFGLPTKGGLHQGMDADLAAIDEDFNIVHLVASGRILIRNGEKTFTPLFS